MTGVNIFGGGYNNKKQTIGTRGPAGVGFKYLDKERNYDIGGKRLANVSIPVDKEDACNKSYVDNHLENSFENTKVVLDENISYIKSEQEVMLKNI